MERMRIPVKDILVLRREKMTEVLPKNCISNKFKIVQDGVIGNKNCHLGTSLNVVRDEESAQEIVGMGFFIRCFREWDGNTSGIDRSLLVHT